MSALEKALAKKGLASNAPKSEKKTSMVTVAATADITKKVDRYLELEEKIKDAQTEVETICGSLREFATEYIVKNNETNNLIIEGSNGAVNVNVKDQYADLKTKEQYEALAGFLKKKKIPVEKHVTEVSKVEFDFNKLTEAEQEKLMDFLVNSLGAERYNQVVTTKTTYKISNLKDEMIKKVKSVDELEEFRSLSSHYSFTIARRK